MLILVQECAVDNSQSCCWSSKLKFFAKCQKIFLPRSPSLCCFGVAELHLTWYVTAVLPPHLLKLELRCLPLHILGSLSLLAVQLMVLFLSAALCSSSLLQDK